MKRWLYGESVQGASHVRKDIPCQDSYKKDTYSEEITIIAVADGHGSESCPYSKTGSQIAVNTFVKVMKDLLRNFEENQCFLFTYLNREGDTKIAQTIELEWKRRVWKAHLDNKRVRPVAEDGEVDKSVVYKQYGTTLLGLLVTAEFVFALQIGDGDIVYVEQDLTLPVIEADKILGTETHSLCKMEAWKKAICSVRLRTEVGPCLYMVSTDGFANSYRSEEDFVATCRSYYEMIQEHGFDVVSRNLREWLKETSELGCGDDTTVVLLYFAPEVME
ncbi:MAG: protein phosphatase 2C domain-containing protein [Alistipes sp.]|nr:protein phosphatase 2C domain-containing protein [Alistipes sp.]